jgi:hypothetical protein
MTTKFSPVLNSVTLAEARAQFDRLDEALNIVPTTHRATLNATLDTLLATAGRLEMRMLLDVVKDADVLLSCTTTVPRDQLRRLHPESMAATLHMHRNTLLALVLAAVIDYNGNVKEIAKAFKPLARRTADHERPCSDDEILVLRLWTWHGAQNLTDADTRRAAAVYAAVDAGAFPGETPSIKPDDVQLSEGDPIFLAPGHRNGVDARCIALDTYNAAQLLPCLQDATGTRRHLTYVPRTNTELDYGKAAASATQIIDRFREILGLIGGDITSSSVTNWRIVHTVATNGIVAGRELSGLRNEDRFLDLLPVKTATTVTTSSHAPKLNTFAV